MPDKRRIGGQSPFDGKHDLRKRSVKSTTANPITIAVIGSENGRDTGETLFSDKIILYDRKIIKGKQVPKCVKITQHTYKCQHHSR